MDSKFPGIGKRIRLEIPVNRLLVDPENPRLAEYDQGKKEETTTIKALLDNFDLTELSYSMASNGYFDEEPLVAVPRNLPKEFESIKSEDLQNNSDYKTFIEKAATEFITVEGNRRLATVKILLSNELRGKFNVKNWPEIPEEVKKDLEKLPVIVYPRRIDVLPYLGVRHIVGIKKWESFAKARYIAGMVAKGHKIEDLQQQVGDRLDQILKIYVSYQLLQQVEQEFDLDTTSAKNNFSFLILAIGQGSIKEYLGLPKSLKEINLTEPVPKKNLENLRNLFSWLYGEGKELLPAIAESRDITSKLTPILRSRVATDLLVTSRDMVAAFEIAGGEENLLLKYLKTANRNLQLSLGFLHRYKKNDDVKEEISKLTETLAAIQETLTDK